MTHLPSGDIDGNHSMPGDEVSWLNVPAVLPVGAGRESVTRVEIRYAAATTIARTIAARPSQHTSATQIPVANE